MDTTGQVFRANDDETDPYDRNRGPLVEFTLIHGTQLEVLRATIQAHGWVPLNPMTACAMVAYEGDQIVGFCAMNPLPHVEPLFVAIPQRGTGLAGELVKRMVQFLYDVEAPAAYIVADNPVSQRLAEAYGMERVTSPVYRKQVR